MPCIRSSPFFPSYRAVIRNSLHVPDVLGAHAHWCLRGTRLLSPVILNPIAQTERHRHHMKPFLRAGKCFFRRRHNLRSGIRHTTPAFAFDSRDDILPVMQWAECVQHHLSQRDWDSSRFWGSINPACYLYLFIYLYFTGSMPLFGVHTRNKRYAYWN